MHNKFIIALVLPLSLLFASCDDETGTIGISTMPSTDQSTTTQAVFDVLSRSIEADSLAAFGTDSYLGRVTDPETNSTTTCNFVAQFATLEDDALPPLSAINKDEEGQPVADSIVLNLYIKSYYGDSVNSMKIGVYELDSANVLPEGQRLYTNFNPEDYVSTSPTAVSCETTFAVADFNLSDTLRLATSTSRNIRIVLPAAYGSRLLRLYYEHPEYFRNSYTLIRHALPGFYFKVLGGNGTMVSIDLTTLTIFFRYTASDNNIYTGIKRVASTGEVIQCTQFDNRNLQPLLEAEGYTFVKSPVALFTELTLPVSDIMQGHERDSLNSAMLVLPRHNSTGVTDASSSKSGSTAYTLPAPQKLLMVPKSELHSFFADRKVPDNKTSFVAEFSSANNSYTYTNIAPLITRLYKERRTGDDPDWQKVVLVPVSTDVNSSGSIINTTVDRSLSSVRLVGGSTTPSLNLRAVYSSFRN